MSRRPWVRVLRCRAETMGDIDEDVGGLRHGVAICGLSLRGLRMFRRDGSLRFQSRCPNLGLRSQR